MLLAVAPALATGGAELDYAVTCQGCHLGDGSGTEKPSGDKPKDVTKPIDGQLAATTYLPLKR